MASEVKSVVLNDTLYDIKDTKPPSGRKLI